MTIGFKTFQALHKRATPFLIGNAWDAQSAHTYQQNEYEAVATSSAAVAASLGFADGENMPFEDYLFVIRHIKNAVTVPLSVDLEGGFARDVATIAQNIAKLHEIGVVGINLEDSVIVNGSRSMLPVEQFATTLTELVQTLQSQDIEMFINVRCDAFLLGLPNALQEGIARTKAYEGTGIDGIFMPCITDADDIRALSASTVLPLSVMCMPSLPDFRTLQDCGVKRISFGSFMSDFLNVKMKAALQEIRQQQNFNTLF